MPLSLCEDSLQFGSGAPRQRVAKRMQDLLEAGVLVYLDGLGIRR